MFVFKLVLLVLAQITVQGGLLLVSLDPHFAFECWKAWHGIEELSTYEKRRMAMISRVIMHAMVKRDVR